MIELNVGDFFLYESKSKNTKYYLKDYSIVLKVKDINDYTTFVVKALSEESCKMVGHIYYIDSSDFNDENMSIEKITDQTLIKELQFIYDKLRVFK